MQGQKPAQTVSGDDILRALQQQLQQQQQQRNQGGPAVATNPPAGVPAGFAVLQNGQPRIVIPVGIAPRPGGPGSQPPANGNSSGAGATAAQAPALDLRSPDSVAAAAARASQAGGGRLAGGQQQPPAAAAAPGGPTGAFAQLLRTQLAQAAQRAAAQQQQRQPGGPRPPPPNSSSTGGGSSQPQPQPGLPNLSQQQQQMQRQLSATLQQLRAQAQQVAQQQQDAGALVTVSQPPLQHQRPPTAVTNAQYVLMQQQRVQQAMQAAKLRQQEQLLVAAGGPQTGDHQDINLEDEEQEEGEIYSMYRPAKVTGQDHPDVIVETATLASVVPPNPTYAVHEGIQADVDQGRLSSAQHETLVYANMRYNGPRLPGGARAGFFLGDGAGVGKGRQIAALIKEYWLTRKKGVPKRVLWVSTSTDLRFDARRDLRDLHDPTNPKKQVVDRIHVVPKDKDALPKGRLSQAYEEGVLFVTYSLLAMGNQVPGVKNGPLAKALTAIHNPRQQSAGPTPSSSRGGRGGRGRGRGRGGNSSRAGSLNGPLDGEGGDGEDSSMAPTGWEEQDGEEFGGGRGGGRGRGGANKKPKPKWKRAPNSAFERAAGELFAADIAPGSRLWQIVEWLAEAADGDVLIVLDECHRAKNLVATEGRSTKTGIAVLALQNALPNARVVYSSATGASEPSNMAYMVRMLPAGFGNTYDMIKTLQTAGLGSLELFCMGLKAMGSYLARTLSYHGANFVMDDVQLSPQFRVQYDRGCEFWQLLWQVMCPLFSGMENRMGSLRSRQFWAAHQRFFRQMLMAAKVPSCASLALDAVNKEGMCVVIGLQSTGEANTTAAREAGGDELDDLVSAPRMVLQQYVEKWFPEDPADLARMSNKALKKLLLDVYKVAKQWEGLPSCDEIAAVMRREKRLREKRRVRQQAAAAGAPVPPPQPLQEQQRALPAPEAAAAAGGQESDDEPIEVTAELSIDQILAVRRTAAARQGLLVDLTTEAPEDELAAAQAELEAKEREEDAAQRAAALANKRKALEEAVADAQKEVDAATALLEGRAADTPSPSASPTASSDQDLTEDSMDVDDPAAAAAGGGATSSKGKQDTQAQKRKRASSAAARKRQRGNGGKAAPIDLSNSGSESDSEGDTGEEGGEDGNESPPGSKQGQKQRGAAAAAAAGGGSSGGRPRRAAAAAGKGKQVYIDDSGDSASESEESENADEQPKATGKQQQPKDKQQPARKQQQKSRLHHVTKPSGPDGAETAAAAAAAAGEEELQDELEQPEGAAAAAAAPAGATHQKRRRAQMVRDSSTDSEQQPDGSNGKAAAGKDAGGSNGGSEDEALQAAVEDEEDRAAETRRKEYRQLHEMQRLQASEMRQKKNTLSTVRQLAAKRRLERAKVDLARAAEALERWDKEQRGSRPASPESEEADGEQAPSSAGRGMELVASRITRGVAFKGTQVINSATAAGALTGYRHSVATKALEKGWEKDVGLDMDGEEGGRRRAARGRGKGRAAAASRSNSKAAAADSSDGPSGDDSSSDDESQQSSEEYRGSDDSSAESDSAASSSGSDDEDGGEEERGSDMSGSTGAAAAARGGSRAARRGSAPPDPAAAAAAGVQPKDEKKVDVKGEVKAEAGGGRGRGAAASRGSSMNLRLEAEDLELVGLRGFANARSNEEDEKVVLLARLKRLLLRMVSALELPANPLDQLIELLGGESKVAEMTGRKGLLVRGADGKVTYRQRGEDLEVSQKLLNIQEKDAFMQGKKFFAIISDAASTGISLQADKRVKNKRRRCHITLELPWSADKAIQQFGRSHRSNQESAPVYHLLMTPVGGERRFAGAVAKRLSSLGALLQGDRRAVGAGESLREFDIDNRWGRDALARLYDDVMFKSLPMPGVKLPEPDSDEEEDTSPVPVQAQYYTASHTQYRFFQRLAQAFVRVGLIDDGRAQGAMGSYLPGGTLSVKEAVKKSVPRFLNRLLGLSLADQKMAFGYFQAVFDATVTAAKSKGEYDSGIRSLSVPLTQLDKRVLHTDKASGASTAALTLAGDMGFTFDGATAALQEAADLAVQHGEQPSPYNGFYIDKTITDWGGSGRPRIMLVTQVARESTGQTQSFQIRRPNNGFERHRRTLRDIQDYWKPLKNLQRAEAVWSYWYEWSDKHCMHGPNCSKRKEGRECTWGGRHAEVQMISGAVLPVWKLLHEVVSKSIHGRNAEGEKKRNIQVQRGHLTDGSPVIGMTMDANDFSLVMSRMEEYEAQGGVEALARALASGNTIWGDLQDVWAPDDNYDDTIDVDRGMALLRGMAQRQGDAIVIEEDSDNDNSSGNKSASADDTSSSGGDSDSSEEEDSDSEPRSAAAAKGSSRQAAAAAGGRGGARGAVSKGGGAAGSKGAAAAGRKPPGRPQRKPAARKAAAAAASSSGDDGESSSSSSSEDEDSEEEQQPLPPRRARAAPAAAAARSGRGRPQRQPKPTAKAAKAQNSSSSSEEGEGDQEEGSAGESDGAVWPPPSKRQRGPAAQLPQKTPDEALLSARRGLEKALLLRSKSQPGSGAGSPAVTAAAAAAGGGSREKERDTSSRGRRSGSKGVSAAAVAAALEAGRSKGSAGSKQTASAAAAAAPAAAAAVSRSESEDDQEVIEISDSD